MSEENLAATRAWLWEYNRRGKGREWEEVAERAKDLGMLVRRQVTPGWAGDHLWGKDGQRGRYIRGSSGFLPRAEMAGGTKNHTYVTINDGA